MRRLPSRARPALAAFALVVLLLGAFGAGIWVDQTFPESIPILGGASVRGPGGATEQQALRVIRAHYWNENVDQGKLDEGGVRGMVQSLGDPYSQYLSRDQYQREKAAYQGRHSGMIGVFVSFAAQRPVISGVLPGSPAQKAGLQAGDIILTVNGEDTTGLTPERVSALIAGSQGSLVDLQLQRGAEPYTRQVQKATFTSPTVQSTRMPGGVLYLRVYQFGDDTQRQFDQQLKAGLPARGVILDLRGNGGGLVQAATAMVSRFVSSGEVFTTRGRDGQSKTNVEGDHPASRVPLAVLVNGSTASAAEIVSGSLQAHHRAKLIGSKTYGKGSVQVDYPLSDGSDLHLTVQHWYLPDGRSIDGKGLQPDVQTDLPQLQDMYDVASPQRGYQADTQLSRALSLLSG
ncbi:MAG: S41 family peptidase [Candidatus Dormibacteraeota bacterium]|nr:S41 family peptidase [Candidatus Dormibacteraeota bacterium]